MNKSQLKAQIEQLAADENISFVAACKAMQSAASQMGDEKLVGIIGDMKMESLGL